MHAKFEELNRQCVGGDTFSHLAAEFRTSFGLVSDHHPVITVCKLSRIRIDETKKSGADRVSRAGEEKGPKVP